jgi:solute carrier family 13 (sodium-dependent dicarboxylate transporter), member 2/3/5
MLSTPISLRKAALCAFIAALILLIPVDGEFTKSVRITCAVGLLMALLWLTEAVPMGLTALVPLVAFPMAGVSTMEKIAAPYANSAVFLFLGGFLVASAFERWGLHSRFAYAALSRVGTQPRRIVFAIILVTATLSMWISNTATTLMMTPIAVAVVTGLAGVGRNVTSSGRPDSAARVAEATLLGVAYAASLGGLGTPIGTPTNLIFFGAARELFPNAPTISFAQWMVFGVAYLVLLVPICWLLVITMCRVGAGGTVTLDELGLKKPGAMSRAEKTTLILCAATALLWMFRADINVGSFRIPGWSHLFPNPKSINDATVAVTMAFLAFLLPAGKGERLLEWEEFKRVPWDVLILFGGGFALADALETSGFSKFAGARLSFVGDWPPVLMIVVVCIVVTLLSEVASNVATATAMMPIAAALATSIGVHPYFLMIPAVLAASSGFMLPVATAPNTIVYGTGYVSVKKMARSGVLLDIAAAVVITLLMFTVIPWATGINLKLPLPR